MNSTTGQSVWRGMAIQIRYRQNYCVAIIFFVVTQCMARYLSKVFYKYNLISLLSPLSWLSGVGWRCMLTSPASVKPSQERGERGSKLNANWGHVSVYGQDI